MKIEIEDSKIIVYLYNKPIDINNFKEINNQIKVLFIKIMKRYKLDFYGYNKVNVYHNNNYGTILEIEKIYDGIRYNVIDLKVTVYKNIPMYLEFEDYLFNDRPSLIVDNNKFYLEITRNIDINKYIEYGRVRYLPNLKKIKK